jgi:hypothetical protein
VLAGGKFAEKVWLLSGYFGCPGFVLAEGCGERIWGLLSARVTLICATFQMISGYGGTRKYMEHSFSMAGFQPSHGLGFE